MSYCVVVVARNAAQHLSTTLNSLLRQTISPKRVIVVNDGSTDETGRILLRYKEHDRTIHPLTLPDRGYDIRRVPSNINLAWKLSSETSLRTEFFMISGDDCSYPTRYAETLIARMQSNERLAVASGLPSSAGAFTREHGLRERPHDQEPVLGRSGRSVPGQGGVGNMAALHRRDDRS